MLAVILLATIFAPVLAVHDNSASVKAHNVQAGAVHTNLTETNGVPRTYPYYDGEYGGKTSNDEYGNALSQEDVTGFEPIQEQASQENNYLLQTFDTPVHDIDVREMMYQSLVLSPTPPKSSDELWFYNPNYAIDFCIELIGEEEFNLGCFLITAEAGNVEFEAQLAIAYELFHRVDCWAFNGDSLYEIISQSGQYYSGHPLLRGREVTVEDVPHSVKVALAQAYFFPSDDISNGAYFHISPRYMDQTTVNKFYELYGEPCYSIGDLIFFTKDYGDVPPPDWDGNYESVDPIHRVYWEMAGFDTEDIPTLVEVDMDGNIIWINEDYPDQEMVKVVIRMVEQSKKEMEEAKLKEAAEEAVISDKNVS